MKKIENLELGVLEENGKPKKTEGALSYINGICFNKNPGYVKSMYNGNELIITKNCKLRDRNIEKVQWISLILFCGIMLYILCYIFQLMNVKSIDTELKIGVMMIFLCVFVIGISVINIFIFPESCKRFHSAEHMIINFWNTNFKFPEKLENVENYSRVSDTCGTTGNVRGILTLVLMSGILVALLAVIEFVKYVFQLSNQISSLISCFCLFAGYFIFVFYVDSKKISPEKKLFYGFSLKISRKIQIKYVTSINVSEKELIAAYFGLMYWVKETQPRLFDEIFDKKIEDYWLKQLENLGYKLKVE